MFQADNNAESESGVPGGRRNLTSRFPENSQMQIPEEAIRLYKDCSNESFYKAGLPFAVIVDVYKSYMQKKAETLSPPPPPPPPSPLETSFPIMKSPYFKRGLSFLANIFIGSFLYTPVCYARLKEFHIANQKKKLAEQQAYVTPVEGSSTKPQEDDFSYPTDIMTNIGDSESSFSADFNSTKFIMEDEVKPKPYQTTYDDLRSQNRGKQNQPPVRSPEPAQRLSPPPEPVSTEPPPRRVKRNKYGDEME